MLTLKDTTHYYVYSHLQALQDYRDELAELQEARKEAILDAATVEDIDELDFLITLTAESIETIKHLAN